MELPQYIYLLKEREFIKTNENIYKIGKTTQQNNERFKQYPKGSILLLQSICSNCHSIEKEMIKQFKNNFKQRNDIGNEYFEGNLQDMIRIIIELIKLDHLPNHSEQENNDDSIHHFMIYHIKLDSESVIKVCKLYDLFKEWWALNHNKKCPSLYQFRMMINNTYEDHIIYDYYTWKGITYIQNQEE